MNYELIINVKKNNSVIAANRKKNEIQNTENTVEIALLGDRRLLEIHKEPHNNQQPVVGDLFLGKITKILPGLNAAFVNVGLNKEAFLHYLDLGPRFNTSQNYLKKCLQGNPSSIEKVEIANEIDKNGNITNVLEVGDFVLTQIAKEPISSKGARLCSELTLPGRYLVVLPLSNQISISQKIENEAEKERLKNIIRGIRPKNFGVIVRTVAENVSVEELETDLKQLVKKYKDMLSQLKNVKKPGKILSELSRLQIFLRDSLNENFSNIYTNDEELLTQIKEYVKEISPEKTKIVQLYKGEDDIFEYFNVNKQVKLLFGKQVPIKSGAYLIVEHTEALHVIDVNTGGKKFKPNEDDLVLETNLEAAKEIARLLRLRDIGGIIVIDFIDMHNQEKNKILYQKLKEFMKEDRAQHKILPPSHFSLVEITRERVRPQTIIDTKEVCYACKGGQKANPAILIVEEIEQKLHWLLQDNKGGLRLVAHPFVCAYLKKGWKSRRMAWFFKYKKWIKIKENNSFSLGQYQFLNAKQDILTL